MCTSVWPQCVCTSALVCGGSSVNLQLVHLKIVCSELAVYAAVCGMAVCVWYGSVWHGSVCLARQCIGVPHTGAKHTLQCGFGTSVCSVCVFGTAVWGDLGHATCPLLSQ